MKKILYILVITLLSIQSLIAQSNKNFEFKNNTYSHDFKNVKINEANTIEFEFINKSSSPMVITKIDVSCHCTTTDWIRKPIKPNDSGKIKVTYKGDVLGDFNRTLTIYTNKGKEELSIKGTVIK